MIAQSSKNIFLADANNSSETNWRSRKNPTQKLNGGA
jgi:hypothetical protein